MISIPIYDMLMLPDVAFSFKADMIAGVKTDEIKVGEDVLFLMVREEKERANLAADDIFSIGISGEVDAVDDEGNVRIRTKERVEFSDIDVTPERISVEAAICPEVADISEEEKKQRFEQMKGTLLKFVRNFSWGMWARSMILHWRNMNEITCALSGYLSLSWEEKYEILEIASERERYDRMEQAVYEFMEVFRVGKEAEDAQEETNQQAYRESALKKQIEFLQKQLDDMHPENVSDVRKFETKIRESGMNSEARLEAEKVLNRMKQEERTAMSTGCCTITSILSQAWRGRIRRIRMWTWQRRRRSWTKITMALRK